MQVEILLNCSLDEKVVWHPVQFSDRVLQK